MKKSRILVPFCAILFLVAVSPCRGETITIEVPANKVLNVGKVFVQAGDVVSFKAEGQWSLKPKEGVTCGPGGESGTSAPGGFQLPGAPIGALVALVAGKPYLVGAGGEVTFDKSGPLQLTVNTEKKISGYLGNKGAVSVRIETTKAAAAGLDGRYEITIKEDQVTVASGNQKKVIPLDELEKEKIQGESGNPVQLPPDAVERLKDIPRVVEIEVQKAQVILRDPQNPDKPPLKGLYDPNKKRFIIHLEGKLKQVLGSCYFGYAKTIVGGFVSGPGPKNLEGSIDLTVALFCAGGQGQKGKGKAVNVSLPFIATRLGP